MKKYKYLHCTTMDDTCDMPHSGVYIIAYMGKVVYVGISASGVANRIEQHIGANDSIGRWLRAMQWDWHNVRVDALCIPDDADRRWLREAEAALVRRHAPVFNAVLQA